MSKNSKFSMKFYNFYMISSLIINTRFCTVTEKHLLLVIVFRENETSAKKCWKLNVGIYYIFNFFQSEAINAV